MSFISVWWGEKHVVSRRDNNDISLKKPVYNVNNSSLGFHGDRWRWRQMMFLHSSWVCVCVSVYESLYEKPKWESIQTGELELFSSMSEKYSWVNTDRHTFIFTYTLTRKPSRFVDTEGVHKCTHTPSVQLLTELDLFDPWVLEHPHCTQPSAEEGQSNVGMCCLRRV